MRFLICFVFLIACVPMSQVEYNAEVSCKSSYQRGSSRIQTCLSGIKLAKRVFEQRLNRQSNYHDLMDATYAAETQCPDDRTYVDCSFGVRLLKEHLERQYR